MTCKPHATFQLATFDGSKPDGVLKMALWRTLQRNFVVAPPSPGASKPAKTYHIFGPRQFYGTQMCPPPPNWFLRRIPRLPIRLCKRIKRTRGRNQRYPHMISASIKYVNVRILMSKLSSLFTINNFKTRRDQRNLEIPNIISYLVALNILCLTQRLSRSVCRERFPLSRTFYGLCQFTLTGRSVPCGRD